MSRSQRREPDFSIAHDDDPDRVHEIYDELRSRCPVAWTDDYGGYWAMTSHPDVRAAAADAETFISSVKAVVPSDPRGIRRPPLNFDAPRHTPFRRALSRTLSPARVSELLEELRPRAAVLFTDFAEGADPDIARTFGTWLPAEAAATWLQLETDRANWLAATATAWVDAWRRQDVEEVGRHSEQMYELARWLVHDRGVTPRDERHDPATSLLAERVDGEPLETELIVGALRQSLVVGMVAPPLLIGSMAWHLSGHPELQQRLREQPDLRPAATEEYLRLFTPYRGFARTPSRTATVHGRRLEPREPVTMVYAAANRDPDVFERPHDFVLGRENIADHLGFGAGRHQCVGQHLARGTVQAALSAMLDGSTALRSHGEPVATRMPELGYQSVLLDVDR